MEKNKSLQTFFRYMALGYVISSLKTDLSNRPLIDIVKDLFLIFWYNFTVGIWVGLAFMFGTDLYLYLKKNTLNEQYRF